MGAHGHSTARLGDGSLLTEDAAEGLGHIVDQKDYLKILIYLLILTVLTVVAARIDFGFFNKVVALGIASLKAYFVASTFMHLKFEGKLILLYAIYPVVLLTIFIGSLVGDEMDRTHPRPLHGVVAEPPPLVIPRPPNSAGH